MIPYLRAGVLENFRSTVVSLAGDADALLREADVSAQVMTIPGAYLPYANYMKLLDCAARATATPHFGLLMARSATAETLGTTGIIMTQAETVFAAWEALARFYQLHDTFGTVRVRRTRSSALVSYALPRNDLPGTRQVYDVAAGVCTNIMKQFCGVQYRSIAYGFPYAQPEDLSCYEGLGGAHIRFQTDAMEIYFDPALLQRKLPATSGELRSALDSYFASRPASSSASTSRRVEDIIRRLLPTGRCTLQRVADTLAVTERTLQLHLRSEQTSFRDLLERVRREIATYHLRRGDMQLTQLAMILGYSELSAFSCSFKHWYGVSPRRWTLRDTLS